VLEVLSRVADGEATLTVETEWQTDVDRLRIDAERRLAVGTGEVTVRTLSGDAEPILRIAVLGGSGSVGAGSVGAGVRTEFARGVLVPELGRLSGAGEVRLTGTAELRAVVRPRAADLAARGLTAADALRRLERVGRDLPLGTVREGGRLRPLLVREPLRHLDELAALRLEVPGEENQVLLGDVADLALEEVADGTVARWRGAGETAQDIVLVDLHRAPGANAVLLARAARGVLEDLRTRGDARLRLVVVHDASAEVVSALVQLGQAALIGLFLGTLVLRVLLGRWRPTLSLAVVVPASLVAAFSAFLLGGISLDLVSLAGLALAAGMLVDNSIVVLEAIAVARERGEAEPVVEGTRQIAMALVASFLTTAVVFLPLAYLRGLARAFFGVQAFAIVSALAISLLLSLSLTPVLSRAKRPTAGGDSPRRGPGRSPGRAAYLGLLRGALAHPALALCLTLLLLASAGWLLVRLPTELVPSETTSGLRAELRLEPGLDRDAAGERLDRLAAALDASAAGEAMSGEWLWTYRADEQDGRPAGSGELEGSFGSSSRSFSLAVPGVEADLAARRGAVSAAVERSGRTPRVEVSASTPERSRALATRVAEALAGAGIPPHPVRRGGGRIQGLAGHVPAFRLAWHPLHRGSPAEVSALSDQVKAGLGEVDVGRVEIDGVEPALRLLATTPADLALLPVRVKAADDEGSSDEGSSDEGSSGARIVPLSALADIDLDYRPPPDERRNGRATRLLELPQGTDIETVEAILAGLPLGVDEAASLGGETRELRRAFQQLRLALGLALVLVFLTVAALYESLALPLAVMTTVPVAGAGAVGALAATGGSLNVMSFLGIILLTGIVVNNGIVLIHRIEQLRTGGLDLLAAVQAGAAERYRPILMTTLTTLLGMLPLALLAGEGAELRRSLATAVCGGLVTSWAGALLVVPVLYKLLRR
jgi:HAE1 family hydrophobic/amphiphilic exporter-1